MPTLKSGSQEPNLVTKPNSKKKGYNKSTKRKFKDISPNRQYPNDPYFYAKDENALKNMASFSWADKIGSVALSSTEDFTVQTALRINFDPVLGNFGSKYGENTLTMAADAFFNYFTQGFTGSVPFESPDLMMYVLAAENVYLKLIEGKRVYGCMKFASVYNAGLPKRLVESLGFDYDSLNDNLADFRTKLNIRIEQVSKWFAVPNGFKIADRWEYLVSHVFADTPQYEKTQFYSYVPSGYLELDSTTLNTGTALSLYPRAEKEDFYSYFSSLDRLISKLQSQDVNNIFGALKRVYGEGDLKKPSILENDFTITFTHDDVSLEQIHNLTIDGDVLGLIPKNLIVGHEDGGATNVLSNILVYQDQGAILTVPKVASNTRAKMMRKSKVLLDLLKADYPGPAAFIDATVNVTVIGQTSGLLEYYNPSEDSFVTTNQQWYTVECRCEVITSVKMYGAQLNPIEYEQFIHVIDDDDAPSYEALRAMGSMTQFNYGIISYFGTSSSVMPFGELTNFGTIDNSHISTLHKNCFFTLMALPVNAKSVTR